MTPDDFSPEALVASLAQRAPSLSATHLATLTAQLQAAGYGSAPERPSVEFAHLLGLEPRQTVDPAQLYTLASGFIASWLQIHSATAAVWLELEKGEPPRRDSAERKAMCLLARRFLLREANVSGDQFRQALEGSQKLNGVLLAAMGRAGSAFAEEFASYYQPESIFGVAQNDPTVKGWSAEVRAWRKFKKLFEDNTEVRILDSLRQAIVACVKRLLKSSEAPSGAEAESTA